MSSIEENLDFEPGGEDMERMKNVSEYVYNTWPSLKSLKQSEQVNLYVKSNKQEFFWFKGTEFNPLLIRGAWSIDNGTPKICIWS